MFINADTRDMDCWQWESWHYILVERILILKLKPLLLFLFLLSLLLFVLFVPLSSLDVVLILSPSLLSTRMYLFSFVFCYFGNNMTIGRYMCRGKITARINYCRVSSSWVKALSSFWTRLILMYSLSFFSFPFFLSFFTKTCAGKARYCRSSETQLISSRWPCSMAKSRI